MNIDQQIPGVQPRSNELALEKIIVYVDDAEYARQHLEPMMVRHGAAAATHWIVVACAPRMTQRISKFVSNSSREKWRDRWVEKLFSKVTPWMTADNGELTAVTARGPLPALTEQLRIEHGAAGIVDARRPRSAHVFLPGAAGQDVTKDSKWSVPGTVAILGALLFLAGE